jgi:hypothetical protein
MHEHVVANKGLKRRARAVKLTEWAVHSFCLLAHLLEYTLLKCYSTKGSMGRGNQGGGYKGCCNQQNENGDYSLLDSVVAL